MRIFVCVKQVPDTETKIRLKPDGSGIDETGIKWIMNPYDEYAVEEAIKLKEKNPDTRVSVVTVGPKPRAQDVLRTAMAMGADDSFLIEGSWETDSMLAAQAVAKLIQKEGEFRLVLTGKLAIDDNQSSFSQQLAAILEVPHGTVITKLDLEGNTTRVEREADGGVKELIKLEGPGVLACNKGLNTPRYASLPGIMKAKKKPLVELSFQDLELNETPRIRFKNFQLPPEKPPVRMISGEPSAAAKELVGLLRNEAKVI